MNSILRKFVGTGLGVVLFGTACAAFQMGGMGGVSPATPAINPAIAKSAAERETIARSVIAIIEKAEKEGSKSKLSDESLTWHKRLLEAQFDGGVSKGDVGKSYIKMLKDAEAKVKERFDRGQVSQVDLLEAQFRTLEGERWVASRTTVQPGPQGPGGGFGGGGFDGGADEVPPRRAPKEHANDLERNEAIKKRLEEPITMQFANETPLDDVIKYLKANFTDKGKKDVPIFINPRGLEEAEKSMSSVIIIDIQDVPVRTTLRLILNQLDLDYRVREGMIYISSKQQFEEEEEPAQVGARFQ